MSGPVDVLGAGRSRCSETLGLTQSRLAQLSGRSRQTLVSGSVPKGCAAHLTHLLDEAPVPLVVMDMEEAAANEGVAPKAVWRNVAKLARSLAVHRQGLWA
jgi:hypothetical protein